MIFGGVGRQVERLRRRRQRDAVDAAIAVDGGERAVGDEKCVVLAAAVEDVGAAIADERHLVARYRRGVESIDRARSDGGEGRRTGDAVGESECTADLQEHAFDAGDIGERRGACGAGRGHPQRVVSTAADNRVGGGQLARREQERIVAVAAGERIVAAGGAVKGDCRAVGDAAGIHRIVAGAAHDGEIASGGAGHQAVGQRHIVGAVGEHEGFDARHIGKGRGAQRPGGGDEQIVDAPAPPCTVSALVRSVA